MKIFSGSSHPNLAKEICSEIDVPIGKSEVIRFQNDNIMVKIHENVRGKDVFVVQTAVTPVNDHIMEMLIMIDALKHASAGRITAVLPYFPYVRSDKKDQPRISITARLMADLLQTAGVDRVLTMDLHAPQVQGFFRMPADHLRAIPIICRHLKKLDLQNTVLVASDAGEAKDVGRFATRLNLPMAIIDKRRYDNKDNAKAVNLIGDVQGKKALLIDDEIATGGTLVEAANFLKKEGVLSVIAAATHAVFCGSAMSRIEESIIEEVVVTNTLPLPSEKISKKIKILSVAGLFGKAILHVHNGESISELFK